MTDDGQQNRIIGIADQIIKLANEARRECLLLDAPHEYVGNMRQMCGSIIGKALELDVAARECAPVSGERSEGCPQRVTG